MSLSNSWRIVRNTGMILEDLQAGKGGAATGARPGTRAAASARPGATQESGRTENTEANPQTR
jgi:hypothetical protein